MAYAKAKRGPLNAGTVGVGSQAHITIQLLNKLAGISIGHVSYRISSQALPDLASGDLQLSVQYIPTFVPQVQSGMVRGLAVTSLKRLPELPDVPTAAESGFPGFEASGWFALFAPAGTPPGIVSRINEGVNEFLQSDAGKKQLANIWMTPMGGYAGLACRLHQERECQMGADHQTGGHQLAVGIVIASEAKQSRAALRWLRERSGSLRRPSGSSQ